MIWLIVVPLVIGLTFTGYALFAAWIAKTWLGIDSSKGGFGLFAVGSYVLVILPLLALLLRSLGVAIRW